MDKAWRERLAEQAAAVGAALEPVQLEQLEAYVELLLRWNAKLNLTRVTEPPQVRVKHLVDSLAALRLVPAGPRTVLDIGSGAGLPGIPWAVARRELEITLVDAVAKKVGFVKAALATLRLPARALHARLEGAPDREKVPRASLVVSRAFASLPPFLDRARPYVASGGAVVAMLGRREAAADVQRAASDAGYELEQVLAYDLPEGMGTRLAVRLVPRGTAPSA